MKLTEVWIDTLTNSWHSTDSLARVFKDAPGYLQNIQESEKAISLEEILSKKKGLFAFFYEIELGTDGEMKSALIEAFKLLQFLMNSFKDHFKLYIEETKIICCTFMWQSLTFDIRLVAGKTFKILIKTYKELVGNFDKILKDYQNSNNFIAIGAIAKYCPKIIQDTFYTDTSRFSDELFEQLYKYLKNECVKKKNVNKEKVNVFLECFTDITENFSPYQGETNQMQNNSKEYCEKLYKIFSELCGVNVGKKKLEVVKNVFDVLISNIDLFLSFMLTDYKSWHNLFIKNYKEERNRFQTDALQTFYQSISMYLLETYNQNEYTDENMFNYFVNHFKKQLAQAESSIDVGLSIFGLGQFSVLYAIYLPDYTEEVLQIIISRSSIFFTKNDELKVIELLPYCLHAFTTTLSVMLKISTTNFFHLMNISIVIFKMYPKMKKEVQDNSIKALKKTFEFVKKQDDKFQSEYFNTVFENGIVYSSSNALFIDIPFQKEIYNMPEDPISYKNYVSLWVSLFSIDDLKKKDEMLDIYQQFIKAITSLIDKLNLKYTTKLFPNDKDHYRCFINMTDMWLEIFDQIDVMYIEKNSEALLLYFIKHSYQSPKESAYYKLVRAIFRKLDITYHYEDKLSKFTTDLIFNFLEDVLWCVPEFFCDLQLSCICLIFDAPIFFVEDLIDAAIPVFKLSFELGLENLELVFMTLDVLETWSKYFDNKSLTDFCDNIVVHLEPYLVDTEKLHMDNKDFEALQKKILLHVGLSKFNKMQEWIHRDTMRISSKWEKNSFYFNLLFSKSEIELNFEKLVSKIIESTNSTNRRIKFSACELLHTLIIYVLGKKQTHNCLSKPMCWSVIKLGCDVDDAVRNLFHPLSMQLCHYFSYKNLLDSKITQQYIDVILETLMDESIRIYGGICLKEFFQSLYDVEAAKSSNFTNNLINKIQNMALNSTLESRIAAATAFNVLISFLKINLSVINLHWLQFLYVFVKCLEYCRCETHPQFFNAVNNITLAVQNNKANILNGKNKDRNVPSEFTSETLRGAVIWLLGYCGSTNEMCRHKCMEMFEHLCIHVREYNKSIKGFFTSNGVGLVNRIALKGLDNCEQITIQNSEAFLKCLDFYMWIFNKKVLSPESVLIVEEEEDGKDIFLTFFSKFISLIVHPRSNDATEISIVSFETNDLRDIVNKIILKIFRFLQVVLVLIESSETSILLNRLWTEELCAFVSLFMLSPIVIGLIPKTILILEPQVLETLFKTIKKKLPQVLTHNLINKLIKEGMKYCEIFLKIDDLLVDKADVVGLDFFVRGIIVLESCDFCDFRSLLLIKDELIKKAIDDIFRIFYTNFMNYSENKESDEEVMNYTTDVLNYLLLKYNPCIMHYLTQEIMCNPNYASFIVKNDRITAILKAPVYQFLLKQPLATFNEIEEIARERLSRVDIIFQFLKDILLFAKENPTEQSQILANELIRNSLKYQTMIEGNEKLKDIFFSVYHLAVVLKSEDEVAISDDGICSNLYVYIMNELKTTQNFEDKLMLLDKFCLYIMDESSRKKIELNQMLRSLWDQDVSNWISRLENDEIERSRAVQYLRCLMRLLLNTNASVVIRIIIIYVAGAGKFFQQEKLDESIQAFMKRCPENAPAALEAMFMIFHDKSLSWDERLDVLNLILIPSLKTSGLGSSTIKSFYDTKANKLSSKLFESLSNMSSLDRTHELVTRIGYFKLTELTFLKTKNTACIINEENSCSVPIFLIPIIESEAELTRQLNCSIFNYLISMSDAKNDNKPLILMKNSIQRTNFFQRINFWIRIVDCKRVYNMRSAPTAIFKYHVTLRHPILDSESRNMNELDLQLKSYFGTSSPDSGSMKIIQEPAKKIVLEDDELNRHECMPMLTALWMYLINNKIVKIQGQEQDNHKIGQWMDTFRMALNLKEDNITLFVLRLLGNIKKLFLPFLPLIFSDVAKALIGYLANNAINYLVRDMTLMFIETNFHCDNDREVAQTLIESLINRALDDNPEIYRYNVALIEDLVKIWNRELRVFSNLVRKIEENSDFGMRLVLMLFRYNVEYQKLMEINSMHTFVRKHLFSWRNPSVELCYEVYGWIVKGVSVEIRHEMIVRDLEPTFDDMERLIPYPPYETGKDCCVRQFYCVFTGCPEVATYKELKRFMIPKTVTNDQRRVECLEMLLEFLKSSSTAEILDTLEYMDLESVLYERFLLCLDVTFEIIHTLTNVLTSEHILPYISFLEPYVQENISLKHRKKVYSIFMDIYLKYVIDDDEDSCYEKKGALLDLGKKILINGIADPSDEIRREMINFWKRCTRKYDNLIEYLPLLLAMYDSDIASTYAQFLSGMLLELSLESVANRGVLFRGLSQQLWINDYELPTPRLRTKLVEHRVPRFGATLAKQFRFSVGMQSNDMKPKDEPIKSLRKSDNYCELNRVVVDKLTRSNEITTKFRKFQNSSKIELSKRSFTKETDDHSVSVDYYTNVHKEITDLNNSVKVNRRHRIGHVPDIRITQIDIITTLQDLALRDRYFANELTANLISSILFHYRNSAFYAELMDRVAETCNRVLETPNDFAPVAMEILHLSGGSDFSINNVVGISRSMNLQISGILLLERYSINNDQSIYDMRKDLNNRELQHNMELISLYQSIGEKDIVQSILKNWMNSADINEMYQGYQSENDEKLIEAVGFYDEINENCNEFCSTSIFRCLNELGDWGKLDTQVINMLEESDVWSHPKKRILLPQMFTSKLQKMLEDVAKGNDPNFEFFKTTVELSNEQTDIPMEYGEELSIFSLFDESSKSSLKVSRMYLNSCLNHLRKQWTKINPFDEYTRLQLVAKLGRLADVDTHLLSLCSSNLISATKDLLAYWNSKPPEPGSGLLDWIKKVNFRLGVSSIFLKNLESVSMDSGMVANLLEAGVKQRLKLADLAVDCNNEQILHKQIVLMEKVVKHLNANGDHFSGLEDEVAYASARCKLLAAENEEEIQQKFDCYLQTWLLIKVINRENVDLSLKIRVKQQLAKVLIALHTLIKKDPRYLLIPDNERFIKNSLNEQNTNMIQDSLQRHYIEVLKSTNAEGSIKEKEDNLMALADYCHQLLLGYHHRTTHVHIEYMNSVLTAMSFGSIKATRFFPSLLNYETFRNNRELVDLFVDKCNNIPTYVLLKCYKEILSHLDTTFNDLREILILPIVERLVNDFPSAIMYKFAEVWFSKTVPQNPDFKLPESRKQVKKGEALENLQEEIWKNDKIVNMYKTVFNGQIPLFFNALRFLLQPEEFIIFHLTEILENNRTSVSTVKALKNLLLKIDSDSKSSSLMIQQSLNKYSEKLEEWIKKSDFKTMQTNIKDFCTKLQSSMVNRLKKSQEYILLQSYSPALLEFPFDKFEIQVPGLQGTSALPCNKVMIAKIDSFVQIIPGSKLSSLKITILGTNGKTYEFLVKHGSDLRRNERIQGLFEFMNETLKTDRKCVERHLLNSTYSVVPINMQLSLVQWVNEAKSLRDFIELNLTNKSLIKSVALNYQEWINQSDSEVKNNSKNYKQALLKYFPDEVKLKLEEFTRQFKWNLLRKAFVNIITSVETFYKLRNNFIKYYGVMCTMDWIAGVGDRRVENILIDKSSGKCFGIDFNMVFGTGIDQPIPELVPFRLTAQILGLFKPFSGEDLFGVTMTRVLTALRKDKNFILSYLNMLLNENLKWDETLEKRWMSDMSQHRGVWLPKLKYEIMHSKLNGDNPSLIMIKELSRFHDVGDNDQYFSLYKCIINGIEFKHDNIRSSLASSNLTPEQQMLCLVDQATDVNILGRMFADWLPFI